MKINLRRCFFHSIMPIHKKDALFSMEEGRLLRLKLMLQSGYIFPGCMLKDVIPDEMDAIYKSSNSNCVFLAQHMNIELPSYGGSFFNGEFSAYAEHISGYPSWVFDEYIVTGKKILKRGHFLSEEVCVQDKIDLHDAIAIMLPYETLAQSVAKFLRYKEMKLFDDPFYDTKIEEILKNKKEKLKEAYMKIDKWKEVLASFGYSIPCVDSFGVVLDKESEISFILENEDHVRQLIKK